MTSRALGLVVAAGAALRFATLDRQSLWYDEAVTARLLSMDLGAMLRAIPDSESSPPLYYALGWLWAQVLGTGEVGLRSLPALLGTATIVVVWALGRRVGGDRAALAAAALAAFNPLLHWFAQEARAYALLALLAAGAALLWLRALEQPHAPGRLLAWGAVAALALATHYYAVFLVAPMALWLALRAPGLRARAAAIALPVAAAAALAPLALAQRSNEGAAFIGATPLGERVAQVPKQFLVGYDAPAETLLAGLTALVLLVALAGLARAIARPAGGDTRPSASDRAGLRALTALTVAALALALLAALAGEDHLIARNVLWALPLVAALAGAGLAATGPRTAIAATVAACALGLVAIAGVATDRERQREDWRGAAGALGPAAERRIVAVSPATGAVALRHYLPAARPVAAAPAPAAELAVILMDPADAGARPPDPALVSAAAGLTPELTRRATFSILRFRTRPGQAAQAGSEIAGALGGDAALLSLPPQS